MSRIMMAGAQQHPHHILQQKAKEWSLSLYEAEFAKKMDEEDPLRHLRAEFLYPLNKHLPKIDLTLVDGDEECVYMCANSLGLQPKRLKPLMDKVLEEWANLGVHGHFHGLMPWAFCDKHVHEDSAKLVGAHQNEVAIMNGLTVNLHLLMISFYRPTPTRHKILLEKHAFPSDHYAAESQIQLHGYDPATSMILLEPREGEELLRISDILSTIDQHGDSIALILLPGVHYYTGQLFDIETITKAGQKKGCYVGWDMAHAVGNVELFLHDWNVDFAVWCTYKYMNTGAGSIAGAFIHDRHKNNDWPKLRGWWGHREQTRFLMNNEFEPMEGVDVYRISNPPILLCVPLRASLDVFNMTSMCDLRKKSLLLTGYMELLLQHYLSKNNNKQVYVEIITPSDPEQRGCHLSLQFSIPVNNVFEELVKRGVVLDKREPSVLRVAPAPLYSTYTDVYKFIGLLQDATKCAAEM